MLAQQHFIIASEYLFIEVRALAEDTRGGGGGGEENEDAEIPTRKSRMYTTRVVTKVKTGSLYALE